MGWFSYCWFWVIWLILNRLLNQSLLPLRIARLATQVCVSFHGVIDCHLMPIDWLTDWLIAISRSINRHSLLVKSGHCAAFADWSTLEEKVDFEPIFSQLVAVTCSQWIQALLKIKKNEKIYFWPGERAMQTLIIMKVRQQFQLLWYLLKMTLSIMMMMVMILLGCWNTKLQQMRLLLLLLSLFWQKKRLWGLPAWGSSGNWQGPPSPLGPSQFSQPSRW